MRGEIWKPIVGLEGLYEVSNKGRVRNLARMVARRRGYGKDPNKKYLSRCSEKIRALYEPSDGYAQVKLTNRGTVCVHVLVLEAFVGPCPKGQRARHLDDVGTNNNLANLLWGTPKENGEDMVKNGNSCKGERQGRSKLRAADVIEIRGRAISNFEEIGREFGVTGANIRRIVHRQSWRHI